MKFLTTIFCSIFFLSQESFSQTITSEKGLTTIVFNTTHAIITVYLPDDLQNGDKVSGTFNVYNEGFTDEQLQKSLAEVRKYKFNFSNPENQTSILQKLVHVNPNQLTSLLPLKITSALIITLTESTGKVYKAEIKPNGAPSLTVDDCLSPEHFLIGETLRITGAFDGDGANTRVSINNKFFDVLAESPRQSIVEVPYNLKTTDKTEIKVVEDLKPKCTQTVFPVKLSVLAEKSSLKKGENTTLYISIKGLQGIETLSHLTVENKTPKFVSLKGGNKQEIDISSMTKEGTDYKMNFTIQGIMPGNFEMDVKLDIPEDFPGVIER